MKITKRKKDDRRAFFTFDLNGYADPKKTTKRSRRAKRAQSWQIDVSNDRHLKGLKIFGRRNR